MKSPPTLIQYLLFCSRSFLKDPLQTSSKHIASSVFTNSISIRKPSLELFVSKYSFKFLGSLKLCKVYFTLSNILTIYINYIRPKMEYNYHVWAGASKTILKLFHQIQERVKVLIGDIRLSNSIDSVSMWVLFHWSTL